MYFIHFNPLSVSQSAKKEHFKRGGTLFERDKANELEVLKAENLGNGGR